MRTKIPLDRFEAKLVAKRVLVALLLLVAGAPADLSADEPRPGLVDEKPLTGRFVETAQGFMVPYTETIPGTAVTFEMVPIPGGEFYLGSNEDDPDRRADEGPQIRVRVEPFWMGKHEVTWGEYRRFMSLTPMFKEFNRRDIRPITPENELDVITTPSLLYDPQMVFEAGEGDRTPAVMMTQYAARQYTKWLSLSVGDFYRLPSEAEWEYACRAGTTTRFYFGDGIGKLDNHAWYWGNSDDRRHEVGLKEANPWGLHDMHGNVAEWVIDGYREEGYEQPNVMVAKAEDVLHWPEEISNRVVRGGSWELDAADCRSAARMPSQDKDWKDQDPNYPTSPWWYTSSPATGVGMRIIRPLHPPAERAGREKFWQYDHEDLKSTVIMRLENEGRGAQGYIDDGLPDAIDRIEEARARRRR